MKKTIVSLALIAALLTACGNIENHFADPEYVQAAVVASSETPAAQGATAHQYPVAAGQKAESKPTASGEPDAGIGQSDKAALISEEQEPAAVLTSSTEVGQLTPPARQPDSALVSAASPAYGAIPFELAAGTGTWWGIDATDSAYWGCKRTSILCGQRPACQG